MRLPEGISVHEAERTDLEVIAKRLRKADLDELAIGDITPDNFVESFEHTDERHTYVGRIHGEPFVVVGHWLRPNIVWYVAAGTDLLDRFPVAFTRAGRAYVNARVREYPHLRHQAGVSLAHASARAWLARLGFQPTGAWLDFPTGRLLLLEHRRG